VFDLLEEPPLKPDELPLLDWLGVVLFMVPLDLEPVENEPDRDDVLGPFASTTVRFTVFTNNKTAVIMAIILVFIVLSTLSLCRFACIYCITMTRFDRFHF